MSDPTGQADATGASTSARYNHFGFPVAQTDANNNTTSYTNDKNGNVTSITIPYAPGSGGSGGNVETIHYGVDSVPTSITDFNGHTTAYTLDAHGNLLIRTDPDGHSESFTYNSAGQVLTDTDRNGNTTSYGYDALGRLTSVTEPGPGSPTVHYTYDAAGNVLTVTDAMGNTTTYTYDLANRRLTSQDPVQAAAGKDVAYAYVGLPGSDPFSSYFGEFGNHRDSWSFAVRETPDRALPAIVWRSTDHLGSATISIDNSSGQPRVERRPRRHRDPVRLQE